MVQSAAITRILLLFHEDNHEAVGEIATLLRSRGFALSLCPVGDEPLHPGYLLGVLHNINFALAFLSQDALSNAVFRPTLKQVREQGIRTLPLLLETDLAALATIPTYAIDLSSDAESGAARLIKLLERLKSPQQSAPEKSYLRTLFQSDRFVAFATACVVLLITATWVIFSNTERDKDFSPDSSDPTQVVQRFEETNVEDDIKDEPYQDQKRSKPEGETTGTLTDSALQPEDDLLEGEDGDDTRNSSNDSAANLYADFLPTPYEGLAPLHVSFEDFSSGNILRYEWDFNGDGTIDSEESGSAVYTYRQAGTFEVFLTVYDDAGQSDTFSDIIEVYSDGSGESTGYDEEDESAGNEEEVEGDFRAYFRVTPDYGNPPLEVEFENMSVGTGLTYAWDFNGDGETDSTRRTPALHTFSQVGDYEISLTITDADGNEDTAIQFVLVEAEENDFAGDTEDIEPPIAILTADRVWGTAPLVVTFESRSIGEIDMYAWDFDGNGTVDSTSPEPPPFTYRTPGDYEPSLVVSGPGGKSEPEFEYITVEDVEQEGEPIAIFIADPIFGSAPLTVNFENRSIGTITTYAWDFNGDGIIDSTSPNPPAYTYNEPGEYRVSLVVNGPGGQGLPEYDYISVEEPGSGFEPIAIFIADPVFGTAPLTVNCENRSGGEITAYAWDFDGDGKIDSTAANPPAYIYTEPGEYEPSLVVSGSAGESEPEFEYITVEDEAEAIPEPVAIFIADPVYGTAPLTVNFVNYSIGEITSYAWDFNGDGIVDSTAATPPPHTYTKPGDYEPSLIATGPGGSSLPEYGFITVEPAEAPEAPIASFTVSEVFGTAPLQVTFENHSIGDIDSYAWDFNGDGRVDSTNANPPAYTYHDPGEYGVRLVVIGPGGISLPEVETIIVEAPALPPSPVAEFAATPTMGTSPLVVSFTNQSSGAINRYAWDFDGDGLVDSTVANPPAYTYTMPGNYRASLMVRDSYERSDTYTVEILVDEPVIPEPLTATFTIDPLTGTAPLTFTFTNGTVGTGLSFTWDFDGDDIKDSKVQHPGVITYNEPGEYTISLTVTDSYGQVVEVTRSLIVYAAGSTPKADLTVAAAQELLHPPDVADLIFIPPP